MQTEPTAPKDQSRRQPTHGPEILHEDPARQLVVRVVRGHSPEFLALLEATVWGTEGLRYTSHDLEEALSAVPDLRTVELRIEGRLVGGYALGFKQVQIDGGRLEAIHRMFLAVEPGSGGKGYGRLLMEATRQRFLEDASSPVMLYGYIEEDNTRSSSIAKKVGYQSIGSFEAKLFSRLLPRDCGIVEKLADSSELAPLLATQYSGHALVDLDQSLDPNSCWVLRRGGQVVAALQAMPRRWTIVDLAGPQGWLVLQLLPRLPILGRLLRGQSFEHLAVSNRYVREGYEADYYVLLEALLARHGLHAAMAFADLDCPVSKRIDEAGDAGLLGKLDAGSSAQVMAGFRHVDDASIAELRERPLFVSSNDPT